MALFLLSIVLLVVGYFVYGKFVENIFGIDTERVTPAIALKDGVDYEPMDWKKIFLIQLLNIAGLGPIFGAISGALFGPAAFLWIVFGCIFAGAVHDFFSGMLSVRHNGASVSEIVGIYLGDGIRHIMRVFSVVLLVLVGTVFMTGPANLLASLTPKTLNANFWLTIIIIYYFLATILPIDKIIGKLYPIFGAVLLIMAIGVGGGLVIKGYTIPGSVLVNAHPKGLPFWALLFVTIACGAISGFHATQSPMMARCITSEKYGRQVFYGAMIAEGIIALIWAAAAMAFFNGSEGLAAAMANGGQGAVVHTVSTTLMGAVGGVLAILGVIACPITSGDTAFRSARLTIADSLKFEQKSISKRLYIAIPLLAIGVGLSRIDFNIIWRYFAWSNQTLAMIMLWAASAYLVKFKKFHWITTIPAVFMTAVSATYIMQAPEGFKLSTSISYPVGMIVAAAVFGLFMYKISNQQKSNIKQNM
ncbi:carbon starvation protein A [Petroclostridium sp. X23]|uniref:carbon starvation CstA family protein n=1 Tax=Petroclostridium sp. X23 TaxID=3045146 RepID=UPI0024AE6C6C|nr:carbon starvation protein A [Petroclostridium sp. X23]WHH60262.1 carbon starvation protein A [Petroclostridium sp. X23]